MKPENDTNNARVTNASKPGVRNLLWGIPAALLGFITMAAGNNGQLNAISIVGLVLWLGGIVLTITGAVQMVRAWLQKPAA